MTPTATTGGPEAQFRDFLRAGELRIQFCRECARGVHYPRVVCPFCSSTDLEFRPIAGGGTVYSTTVEMRWASTEGPFTLSLIDLDEGVRVYSSVVNCDPTTVHIGQRVRATIGIRKDVPVLLFEAADVQGSPGE